ncbi:hypothetical protein NKCBBBOE_02919 [Pseudarthrobacter sp. MM222]|nr:hypothetical protein NKCBBBOE_02919 [Pseudarthrobacter sp. MM222]
MHRRVSGLLAALAITGLVLTSAPAANAAPKEGARQVGRTQGDS